MILFIQSLVFLFLLKTIICEINEQEISEKLKLIESKLQDKESRDYHIEIRKIQNEIQKLTEHIKKYIISRL